ncbi:hypothetical protein [Streptomyces sp. NPDC046909]|uniref:hypothetical protein n=1 Tax=Streptomyces sp. NPDC046909 TaxID=3155617 RepID=UPI0033C9E79F
MSADRETNHDMTNDGDITRLLAGAADEVEIGIAPYQTVLQGGRRRKARRWAVTAATALALAASSATLAVAGLPGGDSTVAPMATPSAPTTTEGLFAPMRTEIASGTENGKEWKVLIDTWAAPKTETQAGGQLEAMGESGDVPTGVTKATQLIGKSSYLVRYVVGDVGTAVIGDDFMKGDTTNGTDLEAAAIPADLPTKGNPSKPAGGNPNRLVIGQVSHEAQTVTCTWKNGTTTEIDRVPEGTETSTDELAIRPAEGSPVDWFVCMAPKGTEYKAVEVTSAGG